MVQAPPTPETLPGPARSPRPRPAPGPVGRRLAELGRSGPSRRSGAAFVDGATGAALTWCQLDRVAAAHPCPPGRLVALSLAEPLDFARAYLAGLAAGVAVAPVDPRATPGELARQLSVLGVADVVVDPGSRHAASLAGTGLRLYDGTSPDLPLLEGAPAGPGPAVPPGVAQVIATSGTTGRPKLVPLSERQLVHVATAVASHHGLRPGDRGYCPLPLFHINAQVVGLLSTVVAGASLVLERRFVAQRTFDHAEHHQVTWLNLVPAAISALCQAPGPSDALVHRVRFARSASAALPVAVLERFQAHTGISVLETYGLTEAASQVCANPLAPGERRPGSVGLPVAARLRIVDDDGADAAPGVLGSVEIAGPGVIDAYLAADGTRLPIPGGGGWFRTGDLGRRDDDGFVYLAGRSDDVINRGGELVEPREVEDVLRADPGVADAVVVGRPHPGLGAEPVAFVRPADRAMVGSATLVASLADRCARGLSRYKRPVEIRLVERFPVGPTGKVARRTLVATLAGGDGVDA